MTALDMAGASLSILHLDDIRTADAVVGAFDAAAQTADWLRLLDAPTLAPSWPNATAVLPYFPAPVLPLPDDSLSEFSRSGPVPSDVQVKYVVHLNEKYQAFDGFNLMCSDVMYDELIAGWS